MRMKPVSGCRCWIRSRHPTVSERSVDCHFVEHRLPSKVPHLGCEAPSKRRIPKPAHTTGKTPCGAVIVSPVQSWHWLCITQELFHAQFPLTYSCQRMYVVHSKSLFQCTWLDLFFPIGYVLYKNCMYDWCKHMHKPEKLQILKGFTRVA
jgi:hypothetical protein